MSTDILQEIWRRADAEGRPVEATDLQDGCRPAVAEEIRRLRLHIVVHLPLLVAVVIINAINVAISHRQAGAPAMHIVLVAMSVGFLAYGVRLLRDLRAADLGDESLVATIRRRLEFCRTRYEIWLIMVAATVLMASMSGAALTDNLGTGWHINNRKLFAILEMGTFLFIYAMMKAALYPTLGSLKAMLVELEAQSVDGIRRLTVRRRLWRWCGLAIVVLCTGLLVALVWQSALKASPVGTSATDSAADPRIGQVEQNLPPAVLIEGEEPPKIAIDDLMSRLGVPAASIAVIDDGRLTWSRAYGAATSGGAKATTGTLFQAGSVSKAVVAVAVMRMVEAGRLDLDTDVNHYLHSWRVPDNEFTRVEKVTLRQLLSHTAGVSALDLDTGGEPASAPSLLQIMNGEAPSPGRPVTVESVPGSERRYSNEGYGIIQLVLADVTGREFPALMRELVLQPARMSRSTFQQPLPDHWRAEAATGHAPGAQPLPTGWLVYHNLAAAGLWTTAEDLAAFVIQVQASLAGRPGSVLTRSSAELLLDDPAIGRGLGLSVRGEGSTRSFGHSGRNSGFVCTVRGLAAGDKGVVICANSDAAIPLLEGVVLATARAYGWSAAISPRRVRPHPLPEPTIAELTGRYAVDGYEVIIGRRDGGLTISHAGGQDVLIPTSDTTCLQQLDGMEITFERDAADHVSAISLMNGRLSLARQGRLTSAGTPRTMRLEEMWRLDGEGAGYVLGHVGRAVGDDEGNVYLLDRQLMQVNVISPRGEFLRALGGEGDGPGETRSAKDLLWLPDGLLGIVQSFPGKIIRLDRSGIPRGDLIGGGDPAAGGFHVIHGAAWRNGCLVVSGEDVSFRDDGYGRVRYVATWNDDGTERSRLIERKAPPPSRPPRFVERDEYLGEPGLWAVDPDGRTYVATRHDAYEIRVFDPSGTLVNVIERPFAAWRRSAEEMDQVGSSVHRTSDGHMIRIERDVESHDPCILSLRVTDSGELWVLGSLGVREQPAGVLQTYDVFDASGRFTHQVSLLGDGDPLQDQLVFVADDRAVLMMGTGREAIPTGDTPRHARAGVIGFRVGDKS